MYVVADTFDGDYIYGLLPDNFSEEVLDEIFFIEIELSDFSNKDFKPRPYRGVNIARHYSKQREPIILVGLREYRELEGWEELIQRKNVCFLKKAELTREKLIKAIKAVT